MSGVLIRVPGSKSVTHRAFLLAAQSDEPATVAGGLRSADTSATLSCLHRLGHRFTQDDRAVAFVPSHETPPTEPLDCLNAGTALRLLMGTVARHPFSVHLTGDASLRTRPNGPLIDALRALGATIDSDNTAPMKIHGPLRSGPVTLPARVSSQYASSLLLSLPMLNGPSTLHLQPPVSSRPYLDVTLDVARAFGLRISDEGNRFEMPGNDVPRRSHFAVEGDWSTAAFPMLAAAITGQTVRLEGLNAHSTQGDREVVQRFQSFGVSVRVGEDELVTTGGTLESPGTVDVESTPDMFPALCILAACARGTTRFIGGAALRAKESDRIAAMADGFTQLGIRVEQAPDGMTVHGGTLGGGTVHAHHDHRIHMAFVVAGLAANGKVDVDGAESAAVSYPNFHADMDRIRGAA